MNTTTTQAKPALKTQLELLSKHPVITADIATHNAWHRWVWLVRVAEMGGMGSQWKRVESASIALNTAQNNYEGIAGESWQLKSGGHSNVRDCVESWYIAHDRALMDEIHYQYHTLKNGIREDDLPY